MLFDTHLLIWAALGYRRLSQGAKDAIAEAGVTATFSLVSIWEAAIKHGLRKNDFPIPLRPLRNGLRASGWKEFIIYPDHVMAVGELPLLHGDPFDKLLVTQSSVEGMTFVTADRQLAEFGKNIRLV